MSESKAELKDRLLCEGRWEAFVRRREELKARGVPAKRARRTAAREFPPLPWEEWPCEADDEPIDPKRFGPPCSQRQAIQWVEASLEMPNVQPEDCPGPSAWALLKWARRNDYNRAVFYTRFCVKVMPRRGR